MPVVFQGNCLSRFELRCPGRAVEKLVELLARQEMSAGKLQ